jgi:SAM-dependent methyltransferase
VIRNSPFDAAAPTYDTTFTGTRLGRWLRGLVRERLGELFAAGDHVLELGCGTGEDAVWLARRGVLVTATDASPGMLAVARAKAEAAGVAERIRFAQLDLRAAEPQNHRTAQPRNHGTAEPQNHAAMGLPGRGQLSESRAQSAENKERGSKGPQAGDFSAQPSAFDGAFSNFGALNCLPDRRPVADLLAGLVRPGGRVALVVMGPLCPWEIGWHVARGRPGAALRRLRAGAPAHVGQGATVRVWYPTPRRLRAELEQHFEHIETFGVGTLLPPSYMSGVVERWPRPFEALALLERRLAQRGPWAWLNDHYMAVFERR